jgi:hypothetical protein
MTCNCAKTHARFIKNGVDIIQINICSLKPRRLIPLLEPLIVTELRNSYPLHAEGHKKWHKLSIKQILCGMEAEMMSIRSKHTVLGLGSRIFLMNFFALVENQDGQLKSALKTCMKGLNFKHPLEK